MSGLPLPPADRDDLQAALVRTYLKQLHLPAMARECVTLARDAQARGSGPLAYLQALLEQEVTERADRQRQRRLTQARFPFQKRLEEFDFTSAPALPQARILELAQGNFVAQRQNLLLLGPSGVGKTRPRHCPAGVECPSHRAGDGH